MPAGSVRPGNNQLDIADQRYGRLVVKHKIATPKGYRAQWWHCVCDCGRGYDVFAHNLRRKTRPIISCGCASVEAARRNVKMGHRARRAKIGPQHVRCNSMRFHKAFVAIYRTLRYSELQIHDT